MTDPRGPLADGDVARLPHHLRDGGHRHALVFFTCFPVAFARLSIGLHVPLSLMLIGIVLRGSAFAFRSHYGHRGGHDDGAGTMGVGLLTLALFAFLAAVY